MLVKVKENRILCLKLIVLRIDGYVNNVVIMGVEEGVKRVLERWMIRIIICSFLGLEEIFFFREVLLVRYECSFVDLL